jgi:tetratricopeptide (TPR) repeat protein
MAETESDSRVDSQVIPRVTIDIPMPKGATPPAVADSQKAALEESGIADALQSYEAGLRAMLEHNFDKAVPFFQRVATGPSRELADRAKVHLAACYQHAEPTTATQRFKTVEEHYGYAVSLMNVGDYVTAREHIEELLKQAPKTDFVIYGLAALDSLTGHVEDSLKHLDEALRLNAGLRFQARNDSDFHNLAEDRRFIELLYPDDPEQSPAKDSDVKGSETT